MSPLSSHLSLHESPIKGLLPTDMPSPQQQGVSPPQFPYGANSEDSSVGSLRGSITVASSRLSKLPSKLQQKRELQVYEAVGKAREIFQGSLNEAILTYLNDNSEIVPESGNYLGLTLYMLGLSRDRVKPYVMVISEDKAPRREALRMIKESGILNEYPGFEIGEMDLKAAFEGLQQLSSEGDAVSDFKTKVQQIETNPALQLDGYIPAKALSRLWKQQSSIQFKRAETKPGRVAGFPDEQVSVFTNSPGRVEGSHFQFESHRATVGGVLHYRGQYFTCSVSHILPKSSRPEEPSTAHRNLQPCDSDDDDCEMTGLSDFVDSEDEDDANLVEITSAASVTPDGTVSLPAISESNDHASSLFSYGDIQDNEAHATALISALQQAKDSLQHQSSFDTMGLTFQIGSVVMISEETDTSLIQLAPGGVLPPDSLPLETYRNYIEPAARQAAVKVSTSTGTIGGRLSGTSIHLRLPHTQKFQEVFAATLQRPPVSGDCGAWVRDAVSGKVFGHIIAGSPITGLILIMPAQTAFRAILPFLQQMVPSSTEHELRHEFHDIFDRDLYAGGDDSSIKGRSKSSESPCNRPDQLNPSPPVLIRPRIMYFGYQSYWYGLQRAWAGELERDAAGQVVNINTAAGKMTSFRAFSNTTISQSIISKWTAEALGLVPMIPQAQSASMVSRPELRSHVVHGRHRKVITEHPHEYWIQVPQKFRTEPMFQSPWGLLTPSHYILYFLMKDSLIIVQRNFEGQPFLKGDVFRRARRSFAMHKCPRCDCWFETIILLLSGEKGSFPWLCGRCHLWTSRDV